MSDDDDKPTSREEKWRETLNTNGFNRERRTASSGSMKAVTPQSVEARPKPASDPVPSKQKADLIVALFDIAQGTADLAVEVRESITEQIETRRWFTIAAVLMVVSAITTIVQSHMNREDCAAFEKRMGAAQAEAFRNSNSAIKKNREVIEAVKATLRAVAASNATSAKVAKVAAANDGDETIVAEVAQTAVKAEIAALQVEEATAPEAEKPMVRKRLKAAAKKANGMELP